MFERLIEFHESSSPFFVSSRYLPSDGVASNTTRVELSQPDAFERCPFGFYPNRHRQAYLNYSFRTAQSPDSRAQLRPPRHLDEDSLVQG